MKNKSYSESETDLLTASTDTLATKKDFPMEVRHDARRFAKFVWNEESDEILGRTETNWARLMFFYFCFMSCLAAYAAVAFSIYLEVTVDILQVDHYVRETPTYHNCISSAYCDTCYRSVVCPSVVCMLTNPQRLYHLLVLQRIPADAEADVVCHYCV